MNGETRMESYGFSSEIWNLFSNNHPHDKVTTKNSCWMFDMFYRTLLKNFWFFAYCTNVRILMLLEYIKNKNTQKILNRYKSSISQHLTLCADSYLVWTHLFITLGGDKCFPQFLILLHLLDHLTNFLHRFRVTWFEDFQHHSAKYHNKNLIRDVIIYLNIISTHTLMYSHDASKSSSNS